VNTDDSGRLAWCGERLHQVDTADVATNWQKIFQRGVQMRRNMVQGRFELWRLYMTDKDTVPVQRMTRDTRPGDLQLTHAASPFNETRRRVRVNRYWNEEFLIVIQHNINHSFNDIFVWKWKECQNPQFLYSHDLLPLYPTGLFPTSFFLYKNFLVLMPETGYSQNKREFTSMIRVHDLSDGFRLVGQYDFPEDGRTKRLLKINGGNEAAHLHRLGDKAVALCRTPALTFYIFSLPDCQLLRSFPVMSAPRSLDLDDLDQRFLMKDNTMMFLFHDPEFFSYLFSQDDTPAEVKYGRFLQVDFSEYVKTGGEVKMRLDNEFDNNRDYIEKICLNSLERMTCILSSGKIVVRDLVLSSQAAVAAQDKLTIEAAEPLQEDYDEELDEEVDTDGPSLCCGPDLVLALRHFVSGRKIHGYDENGALKYEICVDLPEYGLEKRPGYLSLDLDGQFLVAADQSRIVIFSSSTGRHIRSLDLPPHYGTLEDRDEAADKFCWKGHTDFAFTEDGIIVIHSQRNFPVAADIFLFW